MAPRPAVTTRNTVSYVLVSDPRASALPTPPGSSRFVSDSRSCSGYIEHPPVGKPIPSSVTLLSLVVMHPFRTGTATTCAATRGRGRRPRTPGPLRRAVEGDRMTSATASFSG
jgi:hypothetical protein